MFDLTYIRFSNFLVTRPREAYKTLILIFTYFIYMIFRIITSEFLGLFLAEIKLLKYQNLKT